MFSVVNSVTRRLRPMSLKAMPISTITGAMKKSTRRSVAGPRKTSRSMVRREASLLRGVIGARRSPAEASHGPAGEPVRLVQAVDHHDGITELVGHFVREKVDGLLRRQSARLHTLQTLEQDAVIAPEVRMVRDEGGARHHRCCVSEIPRVLVCRH